MIASKHAQLAIAGRGAGAVTLVWPEPHAIALIGVTVVIFFLYTRPWIRMELVSLLLLFALLVLFYAFPYTSGGAQLTDAEVFHAFGHPALVAICSLMVLARGLTMTGALEPAVRLLSRVWQWSRSGGLLLTLVIAALASAFVNDTPVLVLMLPMLLSVAERNRYPAAKALMPVNFAILAGGMLTSIGTSTNLLVLSLAADLGMEPMGLFDFTSTAFLSLLVALPYLWLIAPRLLPDNSSELVHRPRVYSARIVVDERSPLAGKSLAALSAALGRDFPAVTVLREGASQPAVPSHVLQPGDAVMLQDTSKGLSELAAALKVTLFERDGAGRFVGSAGDRVDLHLVEIAIGNESHLPGRTLRDERFAERHRIVIVGVNRGPTLVLPESGDLGSLPLASGDILLALGSQEHIERLQAIPGLLLLDRRVQLPRSPLAPWALGIMAGVVALAATKTVPIHVAAFAGVIAMLLTGCVKFEGIGRALSLQVVLLVASSVALGQSLVATGAAAWIAGGVSTAAALVTPPWQLAMFMAFSALLTNFVSNSAAAAVGTPIAIATAVQLGAPMEPYVLAVLFGANLSYATPMAYQTNLLVMNAAGYRFADFLRVGVPLVLLMLGTLAILLARKYGL